MTLVVGDRTVQHKTCPQCGRAYEHVTGYVWKDDEPWAVYFAACHGHPEHEAWLDVILGAWDSDLSEDRVTFSCQVRSEGASAVDATVVVPGDHPMFGVKLSREAALGHERIAEFWDVVDAVVLQDAAVEAHIAS